MNSRDVLKKIIPSVVGSEFEHRVELLLHDNGLRTLARNFRCKMGEVDLIMEDSEVVVFVEVRYRRDARFGGPFASITPAKQKRLIRAATQYLATKPKLANRNCRFDTVGVTQQNGRVTFDWIRDAFST